jgi:hypothetical protein
LGDDNEGLILEDEIMLSVTNEGAKIQNEPPFKVGEKVRTTFRFAESAVIRTVLNVEKSERCASGWSVDANGGEKCPSCGRPAGTSIFRIDSGWFTRG